MSKVEAFGSYFLEKVEQLPADIPEVADLRQKAIKWLGLAVPVNGHEDQSAAKIDVDPAQVTCLLHVLTQTYNSLVTTLGTANLRLSEQWWKQPGLQIPVRSRGSSDTSAGKALLEKIMSKPGGVKKRR